MIKDSKHLTIYSTRIVGHVGVADVISIASLGTFHKIIFKEKFSLGSYMKTTDTISDYFSVHIYFLIIKLPGGDLIKRC